MIWCCCDVMMWMGGGGDGGDRSIGIRRDRRLLPTALWLRPKATILLLQERVGKQRKGCEGKREGEANTG